MTFDHFIDKILWALMVAVGGYGASQIQLATTSINELNSQVKVLIEKVSVQNKFIDDHEQRLRRLETKK